ncbi:MAG: YbhB/YbcL family Raf kinase inhibitor-like protein [Nanoarchaeota archaeon]|nr:YbhB/YbcL family Raf kinase inhibitor-like protein [Nanoarchaeota archaeon]
MRLTSPAFEEGHPIPSEYTCEGPGTSPELDIANVPEDAKSLVLLVVDPDAPMGTWDHWIAFNIPVTATKIAKGTEPEGVPGKNSWGRTGYGGPCPPSGMHRYIFKIYALDIELDLPEGAAKVDVEQAMQNHVLEEAELMGTYAKE